MCSSGPSYRFSLVVWRQVVRPLGEDETLRNDGRVAPIGRRRAGIVPGPPPAHSRLGSIRFWRAAARSDRRNGSTAVAAFNLAAALVKIDVRAGRMTITP